MQDVYKYIFIDREQSLKGALSRILTVFEQPKFIFVSKETKK